jgi:hypothetical protein
MILCALGVAFRRYRDPLCTLKTALDLDGSPKGRTGPALARRSFGGRA